VTLPVESYLAKPDAPSDGEKHVYLHPGYIHFAAEPTVVATVLGSCVAVCLYDPESEIGGINHYLLPGRAGGESPRSADVANATLLNMFHRAGIAPGALHAKVFGGASIGGMRDGDLGSRNAAAALEFLEAHSIRLVSHDVGGARGRKVVFRTGSGAVWVRLL
jgi:chemotaxis protein CheD